MIKGRGALVAIEYERVVSRREGFQAGKGLLCCPIMIQ
jgi:hypothetical protein